MTDEELRKALNKLLDTNLKKPKSCRCECGYGEIGMRTKPVCEHVFDGPEITFDGGQGMAVTCSRCGYDAMSHTMRCF